MDISLFARSDTAGMSIPPINSQRLPGPATSVNAALHEGGSVTSHLLTQTRDVLYPNMTNVSCPVQNTRVLPQPPQYEMAHSTQLNNVGQYMGQQVDQRSRPEGILRQQDSNTTNTISFMNELRNTIPGSMQNEVIGGAPPWVSQLFEGLDIRFNQIEAHLITQNSRWQSVSDTLRLQNDRMTNIETKVSEIGSLKQSVAQLQITTDCQDRDISEANRKIREYDSSIQTYSDMCDDIRSDKRLQDAEIADLRAQVNVLQGDNDSMKIKLSEAESTITDLQCRSMRDNLIFTGIKEPEYIPDQPEDTELSLREFLSAEMDIFIQLPFHRVHRLGNYEKSNDGPRPIIAKFERFKDREYVRHKAPKTLKGKPFGVREQFPKIVEDRRKLLYPEMKRARANENNKVRLVRDRLFVNGFEYEPPEKPPEPQNRENDSFRDSQHRRNGTQYRWDNTRYQPRRGPSRPPYKDKSRYQYESRVFQRSDQGNRGSSRPSGGQTFQSPALDFSLPTSNRYETLSSDNDPERTENRKHKASSPLDADQTFKKHREHQRLDAETSLNNSYIEMAETNTPQSESLTQDSEPPTPTPPPLSSELMNETNTSISVAINESRDSANEQTITEA